MSDSAAYLQPKHAEIVIEGTDLAKMQAAAEEQFALGFGETKWMLTGVEARLDMISVGTYNEWCPGLWKATFTAKEVL